MWHGGHALAKGLTLVFCIGFPLGSANADKYIITYSFGLRGQHDGRVVSAPLIRDDTGNLYGTAIAGGRNGNGVIFKLAPDGTESLLYFFTGGNDGRNSESSLARDSEGNLYGTSQYGGTYGKGIVFKLAVDGTFSVLHSFAGGSDGSDPSAGVIRDNRGNLYGTTAGGGDSTGCFGGPCGTVFKLSAAGKETVLYSFQGNCDAVPRGRLLRDKEGNLYGTTSGGSYCYGTVFKLTSDGTETVLYRFAGQSDGGQPLGALVEDAAGNLYGTTHNGGSADEGTVFRIALDGTETVLHSFTGGSDGAHPNADLIRDTDGKLYGTTSFGGDTDHCEFGCGTVFTVAPEGTETIPHTFIAGTGDGFFPVAGLVSDKKGHLFGTAGWGGAYDRGIVFGLKK